MAKFSYKAMDAKGSSTTGEIEGESKAAVAAALRNKGITVVDINEVKQGFGQITIGGRVKSKDLVVFARQFATMINSGLAMLRALTVLQQQTENKKFAAIIEQVRNDVEAGIALSDALEKHPKVFNRLFCSMVRAGEIGGILDEVMHRIAEQLEKDDSIRRSVKSAMTYPIMIAAFAVIVMIGMILFLIPIFSGMYKDMDAKLPGLTQMMVNISELAKSFPQNVIIVAAIIGAIWGLKRLKATEKGTMAWDRIKLRIPMGIGDIVRKMAVARFSRTLGTLVSSGVPILQAIEITGQSAGNAVIEKAMEHVSASVKEGQTISGPLSQASVFPDMVVQMLAVGEETGSLDQMLNKVADFYEDEVNASIKSLTSIIEPIMMLGVGALVGTIVISLYLPIFNMMNVVKE
jgi:type IV pilus assembly protein PilC